MAPIVNGRLLYNQAPIGYPEPGKTTIYDESATIDLDNVPLNGGILLKVLVFSIDPYLRMRMREGLGYISSFKFGEPIENFGVAVVLRSEDPSLPVGSHFAAIMPFQQYIITTVSELSAFSGILENKAGLPWSAYVGVVGMPGATAYMGWKEYAFSKPSETVFVTSGAGAVGSVVVQLAKAAGLKVIASAGSDEKVEYMRYLGADVAFNYKKERTEDILKREGGIDIFWDNVGGETLEIALNNCHRGARFIECGMISEYNEGTGYEIKSLSRVIAYEVRICGFVVGSLMPKYYEFFVEFPQLIAEGKIKYLEDVTVGLENAGHAIAAVQKGTNKGKSVVLVAE